MIAKLALDAPDLAVDLGRLRMLMENRAPGGYCTKLILPNSQILYLEVEAPGPDRQSRRAQIAAALEGRTPYAVSELVFDWSQSGTLAKVAVIARETLDEADSFAEENGFCPVAFVAVPEAARFGGEPYFGLTAGATDHITHGERLDRDQDPVMTTGIALVDLTEFATPDDSLPPDAPQAAAEPPFAVDGPLADPPGADLPPDAPPLPTGPETAVADPDMAGPDEAGTGWPDPHAVVAAEFEHSEPAAAEFAEPEGLPSDPPQPADMIHPAALAPAAPDVPPAPVEEPASIVPAADTGADTAPGEAEFGSDADQESAPESAAPPTADAPLAAATEADAEIDAPAAAEAPFIAIEDEGSGDELHAVVAVPPEVADTEPDVAAILQKIRSSVTQGRSGQGSADAGNAADAVLAAPTGFQSSRQAGPGGTEGERLAKVPPRLGTFASRAEVALHKTDGTADPALSPDPLTGGAGQMSRAQSALERAGAAGRAGLKDLQRRAGSAPWDRQKKTKSAGAGKPTGRPSTPLIAGALVGAVAVSLALAVLLWSMFVGSAPVPTTVGANGATGDATSTAQTADLPVADSADANDPPSDESPATPATVSTTDAPADAPAAAPTDPAAPAGTTAEAGTSTPPAEVTTTAPPAPSAAPGPAPTVPVTAPAALAAPTGDKAATIAEAPEPAAADAGTTNSGLALAAPATDGALAPQALPLPFDQMPVLGADGLIVPTVAGVLTPGGYTLYAGKPDLLPPARPAALAPVPVSAPATPAADAQPNQQDDPLFAVKPRARPPGFAPPPLPAPAPAPPTPAQPTPQIVPAIPAPLDTGALSPTQPADAVATADALPPADPKLASVKPKARPAAVIRAAVTAQQNQDFVANAAVDAALAEARAQAAVLNNPTAQAVSLSDLPVRRPKGLVARVAAAAPVVADVTATDASAVDAALAEANQTAAQDVAPADTATADAAAADQPLDEPEPTAGVPNMPTTKTVAKKSTLTNALNLGNINLIGVYGSANNRRALVRMASGRFIKVQIGDALDGGQVAAIGDNELTYVKSGRTIVLRMVKGG